MYAAGPLSFPFSLPYSPFRLFGLHLKCSCPCTNLLLHIEHRIWYCHVSVDPRSLSTGLPVVLKFLKFNRCPEIVLKSAIFLKFYSFGHNVLIWTFVMLSLWHCIHFVLYLANRTLSVLLAYLLNYYSFALVC